ncbi:hypothetical protein CEXT_388711 [Caerostris extrusa]|uniref:Uncharacterized protein n=1 Tax=Caerostris extrusa TaxID=172846 RepID=A0AAV4P636_CAEEX|nr:hypothetical protein CEXT_388711 [Caerostris extrusa]
MGYDNLHDWKWRIRDNYSQLGGICSIESADVHDVHHPSHHTNHVHGKHQDCHKDGAQDYFVHVSKQHSPGFHVRLHLEFTVRIPFHGIGEALLFSQTKTRRNQRQT